MKRWIYAAAVCGLAGAAQAQDLDQGSIGRQERIRQQQERDDGVLRRGGGDARQLERLQRLRQRGEQRVRQLGQPGQASRPANAKNSNQSVVKTQ